MSTPMITIAPRAMIIATPCCDCSVLRIRASFLPKRLVRLPAVAQPDFDAQRVAKPGPTCPAQIHQGRGLPRHDEADARDLERVRRYGPEGVVVGELHPAGPVRRVRLERAGDRLRGVADRHAAGDAVEEPDIPLFVGFPVDAIAHAAQETDPRAYGDGPGGHRWKGELVA